MLQSGVTAIKESARESVITEQADVIGQLEQEKSNERQNDTNEKREGEEYE